MIHRDMSVKLPRHATDEEKVEFERGCKLLQAMIDVVRTARPRAQDVLKGEDASHE